MFKEKLEKFLEKEFKLKEINLEIPLKEFGDYAFPCFQLAKKQKKNPNEIALNLTKKLKKPSYIEKIEAKGPYLNFFVNKEKLTNLVIKQILKEKAKYGSKKQNKKIVIESPGPNTNKPLHLGHLRNLALGLSLSNIYKKLGNKVTNVDIINDRGIHICQSMLAYQKYGKGKKPNKKSDHFVGDYYALYNKNHTPKIEKEVRVLLKKWEEGDKETIALWKKMNSWAITGQNETYQRFGLKIKKPYFESNHYREGKNIILKAHKKGLFKKDENGAIIVNLEKQGLGEKVLLRGDGTSVYVTQDINLAIERNKDWKMDEMVYIVASEQIYHFKVLFEVLKRLKYNFVKNYYHLPYGMIYLPEGKMKSREGTIVDADNLMNEMHNLARKEVKKRDKKISKKELDKRAEQISLGAIKYYILKFDPLKDFTYNPEKSISFEGDTGPYIQYSHARISSILRKDKKYSTSNLKLLNKEEEINLIKLLSLYPEVINKSAGHYKPSLLASYLFDLAQEFSSFYSKYPILKEEPKLKGARMALIIAIRNVLKDGLNLLGMEAPEKM